MLAIVLKEQFDKMNKGNQVVHQTCKKNKRAYSLLRNIIAVESKLLLNIKCNFQDQIF